MCVCVCPLALSHKKVVMANFMATWLGQGAQIIWLNIILNVSARVFLNEINILIGRVKQITLHTVSEPHPVNWKPKQNKKTDPPLIREFFSRVP